MCYELILLFFRNPRKSFLRLYAYNSNLENDHGGAIQRLLSSFQHIGLSRITQKIQVFRRVCVSFGGRSLSLLEFAIFVLYENVTQLRHGRSDFALCRIVRTHTTVNMKFEKCLFVAVNGSIIIIIIEPGIRSRCFSINLKPRHTGNGPPIE